MGKYFSTTAISIVLPGFLKGNTTTSDTLGTELFARQIENAEGKIDSMISARYEITAFTAIPPLLRKLTENISVYNVMMKTGYRANDRNEYMDDFKDANETLDRIIKGHANLTYTDGSVVPTLRKQRIISDKKNYPPIFNLDDETNWDISDSQLSDIEAERE